MELFLPNDAYSFRSSVPSLSVLLHSRNCCASQKGGETYFLLFNRYNQRSPRRHVHNFSFSFFSSSALPAGGATRVVVYIHKLRVGIHRSFFSSRRHYLNVKSQVKLRVPILVFIVPAGYCGAAFRLCCLPHYASSCLLRDLCVCVLPAAARSEERETERRID